MGKGTLLLNAYEKAHKAYGWLKSKCTSSALCGRAGGVSWEGVASVVVLDTCLVIVLFGNGGRAGVVPCLTMFELVGLWHTRNVSMKMDLLLPLVP